MGRSGACPVSGSPSWNDDARAGWIAPAGVAGYLAALAVLACLPEGALFRSPFRQPYGCRFEGGLRLGFLTAGLMALNLLRDATGGRDAGLQGDSRPRPEPGPGAGPGAGWRRGPTRWAGRAALAVLLWGSVVPVVARGAAPMSPCTRPRTAEAASGCTTRTRS